MIIINSISSYFKNKLSLPLPRTGQLFIEKFSLQGCYVVAKTRMVEDSWSNPSLIGSLATKKG